MEADLRAGAAKFYFLYLAELDHFLHLHADDRAAAAQTLGKYSDRARAAAQDRARDLRRGGHSRLRRSRDGADRGDDRYPGGARSACRLSVGRLPVPAGFHDGALLVLYRARARIGDRGSEGGRWRKMARGRRPDQSAFIFPGREVRRTDFSDRSRNRDRAESHGRAALAGMHGFHPSAPHSRSAFVSSVDYGDSISQITDIFGVMKVHV